MMIDEWGHRSAALFMDNITVYLSFKQNSFAKKIKIPSVVAKERW
jgi:hypothetical protein